MCAIKVKLGIGSNVLQQACPLLWLHVYCLLWPVMHQVMMQPTFSCPGGWSLLRPLHQAPFLGTFSSFYEWQKKAPAFFFCSFANVYWKPSKYCVDWDKGYAMALACWRWEWKTRRKLVCWFCDSASGSRLIRVEKWPLP